MGDLPTRWEQALARRVARSVDLPEADIDFIAFAVEGRTYGIIGTFFPQLQQRRILVVSEEVAYLVKLDNWSRPREVLWNGARSEIRIVERRSRRALAEVGGHRVTLFNPLPGRLEEALGSNSA